jgi:hypothetical protein
MEKVFEIELTIEKKNRKYFAATKKNGYRVKVLLDKSSEDLPLGKQTLRVVDMSVRSKYGIDEIYRLESEELKKSWENPVTLKAKYNEALVRECRQLVGKWDPDAKVWVFPRMVEDMVEELDYYYGAKLIPIEIESKKQIQQQGWITFLGYPIAGAKHRDSGADLFDGVAFISGAFGSGGSRKNWYTYIKPASVFRLEISENVLELFEPEKLDWEFRLIKKRRSKPA